MIDVLSCGKPQWEIEKYPILIVIISLLRQFHCLYATWHMVATGCGNRACIAHGVVVPVVSVGKAFGMSIRLSLGVWWDNLGLIGDNCVDLGIWALYKYVNVCNYMSQSLCPSAAKCDSRAITVLLIHGAWTHVSMWYWLGVSYLKRGMATPKTCW